mgnify:CR=1 FL=1
MDHEEYRAALAALSLSQKDAARLLGSDDRTSRRWALGESAIPTTVEIILTLCLENPKARERVEALADEREAAAAKAAKKAARR